ncbi:MAG: division/cell wall cluster transcriptional repressor MraZ [Bacillota bacterium]
MFMGEYIHSMDNKGRVTMPAKFRDELQGEFVVTRGLDNCLFLYPLDEWKELEKKLKELPITRKNARSFVRFFFSGANQSGLDKQGRINLPNNLTKYAGLSKEVVIIGLANRIELWAKEKWDLFMAEAEESHEDIAATMEDLGI